jgi:hypothetical protein
VTSLYWLALVLGGGLALLSLIGGSLEHHVEHDMPDPDAWHILSLRSATYFLFAFGAVGLLTQAAGSATIVSLAAALFTASIATIASGAVFRYLRRSSSGSAVMADSTLVGLTGSVVLPLRRNGGGKIVVRRSGRDIELMARPYEDGDEDPEQWDQVMVVEVTGGTALVTPYPSLPQLPPTTE